MWSCPAAAETFRRQGLNSHRTDLLTLHIAALPACRRPPAAATTVHRAEGMRKGDTGTPARPVTRLPKHACPSIFLKIRLATGTGSGSGRWSPTFPPRTNFVARAAATQGGGDRTGN